MFEFLKSKKNKPAYEIIENEGTFEQFLERAKKYFSEEDIKTIRAFGDLQQSHREKAVNGIEDLKKLIYLIHYDIERENYNELNKEKYSKSFNNLHKSIESLANQVMLLCGLSNISIENEKHIKTLLHLFHESRRRVAKL